MITGLEKFKEHFAAFKNQYVLIGGAACDVHMADNDTSFRATKDLDLVLLVEALTPEFGGQFWDFIRAGQYEHRAKSTGKPQFYRFDKPQTPGYPLMLELFARTEMTFENEQECIPLHLADEVSSLSAILLNDDYYSMLLNGKQEVDGVIVLSPQYLIPFKAKACLDLSERKAKGEPVDSADIKKHKNDIARLTAILTGQETVQLPQTVRAEMERFIVQYEENPVDPKNLKLQGVSKESVLQILKTLYI